MVALPHGALAASLLQASEWFNLALLDRLEAQGWPRITRSQSLVFLHLGGGVLRPAELARRVGISRQSMQTLLEHLEHLELVSQRPDPADGRAKQVRVAPRGRRLVAAAEATLRDLEAELVERIGAAQVEALRGALAVDWGQVPSPGRKSSARSP